MSSLFFALTPDRVLDAVEAGGVACTGLCYALNSLENRVYELEREDRSRVVAKFYRPGRWSRESILDEHQFLSDLRAAEIPVAAPLTFPDGETLRAVPESDILYALFPKVGGRAPEEFSDEQLKRLGMLLARVHNVGASREAAHRRVLDARAWGEESLAVLEQAPTLAPTVKAALQRVTHAFLDHVAPWFEGVDAHRIHGDCHLGNLLWGSDGAFFLDFDDMMTGPAVQDVWLLTPGRDAEAERQRGVLLSAYEGFRRFESESLRLVEPLRALRYLHYAAWVTRRWDDPAFPAAFPGYGSPSYWSDLVADLEEQLGRCGGAVKASATATLPSSAPVATAGVSVTEVPYASEAFLRVLMVRDEVFVEELGQDPQETSDGLDGRSVHLLARMGDGQVAGAVRVTREGDDVRVSMLAVLSHLRRRGVARALLEAAARVA